MFFLDLSWKPVENPLIFSRFIFDVVRPPKHQYLSTLVQLPDNPLKDKFEVGRISIERE